MLLCDFVRIGDVLRLLRTSKHALRLIHSFTRALSCVLRHALKKSELRAEHKARGQVIGDVSLDQLVLSALFTTQNSVRPRLTAEERSTFLSILHSTFLCYELVRMEEEDGWRPY